MADEGPGVNGSPEVSGDVRGGAVRAEPVPAAAETGRQHIDFYRNQLKMIGLEKEIAKTNSRAGEINRRILAATNGDGSEADGAADPSVRSGDSVEELYRSLENAQEERDALSHELEHLKDDLSRTYNDSRISSRDGRKAFTGIIIREEPDVFRSTMFRDGRYDIRLAKDGSYVKFRPDVEGAAVCENGCIRIPLLPKYLPFQGVREYGAIPMDAVSLMIRL